MSTSPAPSGPDKVTSPGLRTRKLSGERVTALTAYDYPTALIVEAAGIDVVLVGDSLANVQLGYDTTIPVSMEEMLVAVRSVRRGLQRSLLVADLPFGSYQTSDETALENSVRFIKAGAEAVKLEGGSNQVRLVGKLVSAGIPVMGHIGLTPQSIHVMGGYKVQGRESEAAQRLLDDASALQDAGAFSIVLEGIPSDLGAEISGRLEIPTIGIGAGSQCDGQILVLSDLLGLIGGRKPKFVRQYADLQSLAIDAVKKYASDVQQGTFPSAEESYRPRPIEASSQVERQA